MEIQGPPIFLVHLSVAVLLVLVFAAFGGALIQAFYERIPNASEREQSAEIQ